MNRLKKSNRSGFTLIELIVVMALMAIIMGAILRFIQPTAKLYSTTNAYLNQEEAINSIYTVLNDDLTYATDVYVYVCPDGTYKTVNEAAEEVKQNLINLGESPKQYNNCIVLDNVSVRDDTKTALAKNSTGSIRKYALTDATNLVYKDVTTDPSLTAGNKLFVNYFALDNLAFMDDYKFFFKVTAPVSGEEQVLTLTTNILAPTYDEVTKKYAFTEHHFSSDNAIEFININSGAATSNCRLASSTNSTPYIYIFYNRRDRIPEATVNVKYECYILDATGSGYQNSYNFTAAQGTDISQQVIDNSESKNTMNPESATHVFYITGMYSTTPSDPYVDGKVYYDLTSASGTGTVRLYAVYKKELKTSVMYDVNIYTDSAKTAITSTYKKAHGDSIALSLTVPAGYDGGYYAHCGTTNEADLTSIKNNIDIYPYYYKKYDVRFELEDGTPFVSKTTGASFDIIGVQDGAFVSQPDGLLDTYEDTANSQLYTYSLVDPDAFVDAVTSDKVIKIKETVTEIVAPEIEVTKTGGWGDLDCFTITNSTSETLQSAKIVITYNQPLTYCTLGGAAGLYSVTYSGNTATVIFRPNKNEVDWGIGALAPNTTNNGSLWLSTNSANNIEKIEATVIG